MIRTAAVCSGDNLNSRPNCRTKTLPVVVVDLLRPLHHELWDSIWRFKYSRVDGDRRLQIHALVLHQLNRFAVQHDPVCDAIDTRFQGVANAFAAMGVSNDLSSGPMGLCY